MAETLNLPGRYYHYLPGGEGEHAHEALELSTEETALLLIDVYGPLNVERPNVGAIVGGDFYDQRRREIIADKLPAVKRAAKEAGLPVVYVTNHLSPGLTRGHRWSQIVRRLWGRDIFEHWREPARSLEFDPVIAPEPGEPVIKKQFFSGFFETCLDSLLRGMGVRNLVVAGFDSRICLMTTVLDAMYRSYRVVVLRDCTATGEYQETIAGELNNLTAIRYMEERVGNTVTSTEWVAACAALRREALV